MASEKEFSISDPPKYEDLIEVAERISAKLTDRTELIKFGLKLLDDETVKRVKRDFPDNKNLRDLCVALLEKWEDSEDEAKWDDVVKALRKIKHRALAKLIEDAIKQPTREEQVEASEKEDLIVAPEGVPHNPSSQGGQQAEKPETDEEKLKQLYDKRDFEGSVIKGNVNINDLKEQPKVLIQTVNDIEYYAVMLQLKEGSKAVRYIKEDSDSYYLVGEWGESGIPVVIIKTSQGHDGPRGSNEETREALKWFPDLKYIFAVGVCGGVEGKVNLGDVVVSTTIQGYYKAKQKRGEHTNRSPCWLVYRRTTFHDFLSRAADNVKCGIVLSADNLMADRDFQKHLLKEYKEAIAFEMEGHGIADACDIVASKKKIVYMVVKGVSDLADEDKDDDWQPEAATNAAKALCKAMEDSKFFGGPSTQATEKPAKKKQPTKKKQPGRKPPTRKQPTRKAPTHGKQDGPPVPKKPKRTA